ncbi:MAG: hypothetical protein H6613_16335 [Ignavibacteriales bacterium]|nr:hypothetical protein [Ignavibacteriales bacterium]
MFPCPNQGDLAYTYGHYTFSATNPTGENISAKGIFHTVWKKTKRRFVEICLGLITFNYG